MKTKSAVILGFFVGVLILLITDVITLLAYFAYSYVSAEDPYPFYGILGMVSLYLVEVHLLMPFGSIPSGRTASAFFARSLFVWGPVIVGWFVAYHVNMLGLWVGLIVSSTLVGYNMVVTMDRRKRVNLRKG